MPAFTHTKAAFSEFMTLSRAREGGLHRRMTNVSCSSPARARISRAWSEPFDCQLVVGVSNGVKQPAWLGTQHKVSAVPHDENRGCALEEPCDIQNGSACNKQVIARQTGDI